MLRAAAHISLSTAAGILFLFAHDSRAATISRVDSPNCNIRLAGEIADGDAARFREAIGNLSVTSFSVCLNSPGGIYAQALQIIDIMLASRASVRTVVERGSECLSACALVFLAGHNKSTKLLPDRKLDVSAKLGFHGPYLPNFDAVRDPSMSAKIMQAGVAAVARLLERNQQQLFPLSLLGRALDKDSDSYLIPTTIEEVGRWSIDLLGYRRPTSLTRFMLGEACYHDNVWKADEKGLYQNANPYKPNSPPIVFTEVPVRVVISGFGDEALSTCVADAYRLPDNTIRIGIFWTYADQKGVPRIDTLRTVAQSTDYEWAAHGRPLWYTLPRKTKFQKLGTQ